MDERNLLSASIRSGANFSVYSQYSRIEDRVAPLKDFCTASTKIIDVILIPQYTLIAQYTTIHTLQVKLI